MTEQHTSISALPDDERPRERLLRLGAPSLSTRELLAIFLRHGTKGKSVLELATELLVAFEGSLAKIAAATPAELAAFRGIGATKAVELQAVLELASRLQAERQEASFKCANPSQIAAFMLTKLRHQRQEEFHVLLLDTKLNLLKDEIITRGLIDRCPVHAREVFRLAIRESCKRIIICHNHPSGDPTPSPEDMTITAALVGAGKLLDIQVEDHLIVAPAPQNGKYFFSFRQQGLLTKPPFSTVKNVDAEKSRGETANQ